MQAAMIKKYKQKLLEIESIEVPQIADDEVLVQVNAASFNPVDLRIKNGDMRLLTQYKMPITLGQDFAGMIIKVGANVKEYQVGDAVYGKTNDEQMGTFAEYLAISATDIAFKPANLSFEEAAALPLVSLTSYQALHDIMRIKKEQKVLIQAESGGVGTVAIQIAKRLGAYVATTTSAKNKELVRKLGADRVIDYHKENFQDVLANYDYVFDTLGGKNLEQSFTILKPGGTIVSIAGIPNAEFAKSHDLALWKQWLLGLAARKISGLANKYYVDYQFLMMHASGKELKQITNWVQNDRLVPVIDRVIPFNKINGAMQYSQSGRAKGKIVIQIK
ncbi:NADP-dependent oxidoreductase [Lactobacillaceae bacterium Melli_B4]